MKRNKYLLFLLVVIAAFWQIFFLQNGMKWDFIDAFLPSRYFFSESILNNQFPLWNPYLLYGTPIYADLVSVFNPEFWIVGNMFGYNNIVLQYMYLLYIFIAGISFSFFLKQFKIEKNISLGLSLAYMLSGLSIGNAQHVAFVCGYALVPFVLAVYIKFLKTLNNQNLILLAVALYLMIFCSYPALTIVLGYLILVIFIYYLLVNWADKNYLKQLLFKHLTLTIIILISGSVLFVAYFQSLPFINRYSGLSIDLANKHAFTFKSFISFLIPMASGKDASYFATDVSMSNGYFGIISFILFLFSLISKNKKKESYIFLFFGVFSLLVALGDKLFLRSFLYNFAPLMNMFQYPSLFRAFTIFGFLAFIGINFNSADLGKKGRLTLIIISAILISVLLFSIAKATGKLDNFVFFERNMGFVEKINSSTKFDNIILQGLIQIIVIIAFILINLKIKVNQKYTLAILFLFVFDGIISTQLNIHYTVVNNQNPIEFQKYLKSSPKGFPIPELNAIGENSDKNASNEFLWMNNNVFPKKVTYDGKVAFILNGYNYLQDNHPKLLEIIKMNPIVYFSDNVKENLLLNAFSQTTVFLSSSDYKKEDFQQLQSDKNDILAINDFSPKKIEISTSTAHPQFLVYQQNFFTGWKVFIDGKEQQLIQSNYTHMGVYLPSGTHTVLFKFKNNLIIYFYCFSALIFCILIALSIYFYVIQNPDRKKQTLYFVCTCFLVFIVASSLNRYFYQKNKKGLTAEITQNAEHWRNKYDGNIQVFLSTPQKELKDKVNADKTAFINGNTNLAEFNDFLKHTKTNFFVFAWQESQINKNVFELISSFYPTVIEEIKNNNSGILLLNDSITQNFDYIEDFEGTNQENWSKDNTRIKQDTLSENHSFYFDSSNTWGTTLLVPVNKKLQRLQEVSVIADVKMKEKSKETILVFSLDRDKKALLYEVSKINQFVALPNQWYRIVFPVDIDVKLQENDIMKVYFWNKNKTEFQIDNLKLKLGFEDNN